MLAALFPGWTLWIYSNKSQYLGFSSTPSTRSTSAASTTAILSVLAARNKCTRYSEHTWNIVATPAAALAALQDLCPSGAFAVGVPPTPAESEEVPVLARFATVCLFDSRTLYTTGSSTTAVLQIINTSYQKLPFGSGDDPDK